MFWGMEDEVGIFSSLRSSLNSEGQMHTEILELFDISLLFLTRSAELRSSWELEDEGEMPDAYGVQS